MKLLATAGRSGEACGLPSGARLEGMAGRVIRTRRGRPIKGNDMTSIACGAPLRSLVDQLAAAELPKGFGRG